MGPPRAEVAPPHWGVGARPGAELRTDAGTAAAIAAQAASTILQDPRHLQDLASAFSPRGVGVSHAAPAPEKPMLTVTHSLDALAVSPDMDHVAAAAAHAAETHLG